MQSKIIATATALPALSITQEESLAYVDLWVSNLPERERKKAQRIFKYAEVDRRYIVRNAVSMLTGDTFEERNKIYMQQAIALGEQALTAALEKSQLNPEDIDFIISTSCTGFMIPSVDAYLINRLNMRKDIVRLPVTEMGCAAGTSALIYAHNLLKANPGKRVAILAAEFPSCAVVREDFSMTNIVCAAIFGDGVACTILGPTEEVRPVIMDGEMYHFFDAIDMMGYDVRNTGFHMVLDPSVPERIEAHFEEILFPFLEKNGLSVEDIQHLIFHPGGKKIIRMVEALLGNLGKNIDDTKAVLRDYGNMSSATVLYVLERFLRKEISAGEYGLMLSFGPGFSAQRVLLQWK
ncbi:MAG: 3-oxoacyl-[acyl-carrier-protein] synthase III C-terminal domain-containing protein [Bacteroidia bacterium]|nr:3-oxoacyl-[acyl-carrier-protein] synthase III C-terminal domain-containing protein [Bacteroidia bacterium]